MKRYKANRKFLKTDLSVLNSIQTDLQKKLPHPPQMKPYSDTKEMISLPAPKVDLLKKNSVFDCLQDRRSVRKYSNEELSLDELSYLLWATQGILEEKKNFTLRTVPCSGATHSFETYLFINRVHTLKQGIYRYLPFGHRLLLIKELDELEQIMDEATPNQPFAPHFTKNASVLFAWSTVPYRSEWKFDLTAHKKILIDVGHICQNLYIAGESLLCGVCAIGIYDQKLVDHLLGLDGEEEFVVYMAAVGKKHYSDKM